MTAVIILLLAILSFILIVGSSLSEEPNIKFLCLFGSMLMFIVFAIGISDFCKINEKVSAGTHVYKKTFTIQEMKQPDGTISSSDTIWKNKLVPIEKQ